MRSAKTRGVYVNNSPGEKAAGRPKDIDDPEGPLIYQIHPAVSPRMRSWESPENEPESWGKLTSRARSQPPDLRVPKTIRGGKEAKTWAVDDLRQAVPTGSGGGEYSLLFLWIRFWSQGGHACVAELDAFLHGLHALSDKDAFVLGLVVDELQRP
jgi:hypothetical protein